MAETTLIGGMPIRVIPNGDGTYSLDADAVLSNAAALTVGADDVNPGRKFAVLATVAGNVTVKLAGGGAHTVAVPVGYTVFPLAVVGVTSATATATYSNLS